MCSLPRFSMVTHFPQADEWFSWLVIVFIVQVTQNVSDDVTVRFLFSCLKFYLKGHLKVHLKKKSPLNLTQQVLFFKKKINLFIHFWLRWVFAAARGLSLDAESQGYSSLRCVGFSLRWLLLLRSTGCRRASLSSCGARAWLLCGTWDPPGPGLEPVSPALAGGFPTIALPGKPCP